MAIFISYSHADADIAHKLATKLVEHNAHVWIDTWELNVGDSLVGKIQKAIQDAGALLVILSKSSVESEWCKKELNAALIRELEEKRAIVLPVLKEDCAIPMFLRDKKYADFRKDFEKGVDDLLSAVAKIINPEQGRIRSGNVNIDWAETWGYEHGRLHLEWELVESSTEPFILLTTVSVTCNEAATRRYREYEKQGLDWIGRMIITDNLSGLASERNIQVLIEDARPKIVKYALKDQRSDVVYYVAIRCRRMGEDNGKDQLVTVSNYLRQIGDYVRETSRRPTPEETDKLTRIAASS